MKKDLIYIILIVVAFMFGFFKCSGTKEKPEIKVKETTIVKVKSTTKVVPFTMTIPKVTKLTIYKPFYDTIRKSDIYSTPIKDSLIEGLITSEIKDCKLINQTITYKPLFPKYVFRTDSVFTTKTIEITKIKKYWSIYGGFNITAPKQLNIYPVLGLKTSNDRYIEGGYDFINKNAIIGLKLNIFKK